MLRRISASLSSSSGVMSFGSKYTSFVRVPPMSIPNQGIAEWQKKRQCYKRLVFMVFFLESTFIRFDPDFLLATTRQQPLIGSVYEWQKHKLYKITITRETDLHKNANKSPILLLHWSWVEKHFVEVFKYPVFIFCKINTCILILNVTNFPPLHNIKALINYFEDYTRKMPINPIRFKI